MIKHTFFAVTLGLLIFFLYLLQYTGAFKPVAIGISEKGPYIFIYKDHVGPYHKIVEHIQYVENWAKSNGLSCRYTFGEYLDNPAATEEGRLKSRGGCLIDPNHQNEVDKLTSLQLPRDIQKMNFEKTKAVVALFNGSPGIGPFKVYPKAEDFIHKSNLKIKGSVIEVYEVLEKNNMNTTYIWGFQ